MQTRYTIVTNVIAHRVIRALFFILVVLNVSACVSFDRMLYPITGHAKHYSFTHDDVVNGGLMVGGVVESFDKDNIVNAVDYSEVVAAVFERQRRTYSVNSAESLRELLGDQRYLKMLAHYNEDRWVDQQVMAAIRDNLPERYVAFARVGDIKQSQSSSCYKEKKKKKKDEEGNDTDEDEDGPDKYWVSRTSMRSATISVDIFDLAQNIIVWSGTRSNSEMNQDSYDSDEYVGEDSYLSSYPYPDYPSWYETYRGTARGIAAHLPYKGEK